MHFQCAKSLYDPMCEAQSAVHETLLQYTTKCNDAVVISLCPSPSPATAHVHTPAHTQSCNPSLSPLSQCLYIITTDSLAFFEFLDIILDDCTNESYAVFFALSLKLSVVAAMDKNSNKTGFY